jgi:hypothetical protein
MLAYCANTGTQKREVTTIYEVIEGPGGVVYAVPDYQFR